MSVQTAEANKAETTREDDGTSTAAMTAIRPFRVDVPEEELIELRRRIDRHQVARRETVADASQGVQLATIQALARYWATEYDWRACKARLNAVPHFITEIDGLDSVPAARSTRGPTRTASRYVSFVQASRLITPTSKASTVSSGTSV